MSVAPRRKDSRRSKTTEDGRRTASHPHSALRHPQFLVVLALVIFAGIPFALGKYFEFSCPDAFDGGSYAYSAEHILSGARIGYDEKPSAQPGTLLVNILGVEMTGYNETGAKIIQMLLQAAALAAMFVTIRRLYGTLAAAISVIVTSVYVSAPLIAKYGNVKEQYMIAFMVLGICCFIYYELTGKWWWAVLTSALLLWGPMFKQTGISALLAVGAFVLAQPLLGHVPWKKLGKDLVLLTAGVLVTLVPVSLWYAHMRAPLMYWPYLFVFRPLFSSVGPDTTQPPAPAPARVESSPSDAPPKPGFLLSLMPGYVRDSWRILDPAARRAVVWRVLRYWKILILPIALALGALLVRAVVLLRGRRARSAVPPGQDTGRFVPLFAVWWFFDMAFIFISPHSYEQYYLPLNASGAMLGSYLVGAYARRAGGDRDPMRWRVLGLVSLIFMIVLVWPVFFGISRSPFSGGAYGRPSRGYLQKWQEVRSHRKYAWQQVGQYIRAHSDSNDVIYVWGWVPGIYVQAQRLSSAPKAFEGTMHLLEPRVLAGRVRELVAAFERRPPKFIVDTRNLHFPWDRPVLELWPIVMLSGGRDKVAFLPTDEETIRSYDQMWSAFLQQHFGREEAERYEALAPLREYVRRHYRVVEPQGYRPVQGRQGLPTLIHSTFELNVVFERK